MERCNGSPHTAQSIIASTSPQAKRRLSTIVSLSSDPYAWLRDIFARLRERRGFGVLAPVHQFEQLVLAVESENPSKAATMREWSGAGQHGLLLHLTSMLEQKESSARVEVELWSV